MSKVINIEVTRRCNLNCRYCYLSCSPLHSTHLSKNDLLLFLKKFSDVGEDIMFTGGEIFCVDYIDDVIKFANDLGLKVSIFTNGTLAQNHMGIINDYVDMVHTSLDGICEIHDKLRGAGTFFKTSMFLKELKDMGKPYGLQCMFIPESFNHINEIYSTLMSYNPRHIRLSHITELGRGKYSEYCLKSAEKKQLVDVANLMYEWNLYQVPIVTNLMHRDTYNEIFKEYIYDMALWLQSDGKITLIQNDVNSLILSDISTFPNIRDDYRELIESILNHINQSTDEVLDIMELMSEVII